MTFEEGIELEKIQSYCFSRTNLWNVSVPSSVRALEDGAFRECERLSKVEFGPDSRLESIGAGCFCESGVELFQMPPNVRTVGNEAFRGCTSLRRVELSERLERLGEDDRYLTRQTDPLGGSQIEEVALPRTLRTTSSGLFSECARLRAVVVEDGLVLDVRRLVGDGVVIKLRNQAEVRAGGLILDRTVRDVVLPEGLERVEKFWFAGTCVASAAFPASVFEVCAEAFMCCACLRVVTFAEGSCLRRLGERCFCASGLERVRLPAALREVGSRAFFGCGVLRSVEFSEGLWAVCAEAFAESGLEAVSMPRSLRELGEGAFARCVHLSCVRLGGGLEELGPAELSSKSGESGVFEGSALESVYFPLSLARIGARAFAKCAPLRSVVLPDGLEELGDFCFSESGLEEIAVGSGLKRLGRACLSPCDRLRVVWVQRGCTTNM